MPPRPSRQQEKQEQALKVAALSRNPETLKNLSDYLTTSDGSLQLQIWPAEATHLAAMVEQEQPGVLLFEAHGTHGDELAALERILSNHPELAVILISMQQTPEFLLRAMRMGVREVMPAPVTECALQQAIGRIRERIAWRSAPRSPGKVLAFLPCKGGSGSTFLASNLAWALAAENKRVCLIDLNLHFGDAALHVSETAPSATVASLVEQIQRLDGSLLESSMLKVAPGFDLLAAPDSPEKAVDVRPESLERLIGLARTGYEYVILDASRTLDANAVKALDCADTIYLVLQLTLPFIRDAGRLLRLFTSLGYDREHVRLLVNRFDKNSEIRLQDVERTLGVEVANTFPNSFAAVVESINHGRPICELAPRDPVARTLREMAASIAQAQPRQARWWNRLLGNAA